MYELHKSAVRTLAGSTEERPCIPDLCLSGMGTDAVLLAASFLGFFALVASWLLVPTDDRPASAAAEPVPQAPAAAA